MAVKTVIIYALIFLTSSKTDSATSETTTDLAELQEEAHAYIRRLFAKYGDGQVMTFEGFEHLLSELGLGEIHLDHDLTTHRKDVRFVDLHSDHDHARNKEGQGYGKHVVECNHSRAYRNHDEEHSRHISHSHIHHSEDDEGDNNDVKGQGRKRGSRDVIPVDVMPTDQSQFASKVAYADDTETQDDGLQKCLSPSELLATYKVDWKAGITESHFLYLGPALITQMEARKCSTSHASTHSTNQSAVNHTFEAELSLLEKFQRVPGKVWLLATGSVVIISLVGLVAVAMIPLMQRVFYQHFLHFLVALAIGSLTGDAFLHLLPHAISPPNTDHHELDDNEHATEDNHLAAVWRGVVALAGMYIFFIMERVMSKLAIRKQKRLTASLDPDSILEETKPVITTKVVHTGDNSLAETETMIESQVSTGNTQRRHSHSHQGQGHGHSHEVPQSVSAVVWMVIMGDGLHNFTDGLAIGAAFVSGISMGISTTVAVFCHELPHELGDFAMLLHGGMQVKQALFYNIFSSILCLLGMVIGIFVGNVSSASSWVFALTAGIFIYIALVDMLPQLTIEQSSCQGHWCYLLLQLAGIGIGIGVMLTIALFEDNIKITLGDSVV